MRPFRFGVLGERIRSGEELLATARRAEALGYATLLLRDHFVPEPFGDQLAPMVALAAAAGATTTLRVGTLVLDNDHRHPVLLAKEAATLDLLSGGRFELGIGAGWLREADIVGVLPRALPDGTISEALSERAPATVAEKLGWVREAAGDRFDRVELSMVATVRVAADHVSAAERFAAEEGWGGAAERVLEMPSVFLGPVERIVDLLHARRERYGFSYHVVPDGAMEAAAPVVERLAGR